MFQDRIKKLQSKLNHENVAAYFSNQSTDLFYLTGLEMSAGKALIQPDQASLFVDSRYYEGCKDDAPMNVVLDNGGVFEEALSQIDQIAFPKTTIPYGTVEQYQEQCGSTNWKPVDDWILEIRMVKDENELDALREVCQLGSKGFDFLCDSLREGVTEKELSRQLEIFWLQNGGDGLAFDPIIAFGASTSRPHYHPRDVRLKKGDPVLFDIGVLKNRYHSDMTRVVFTADPDAKMKEIYEIVFNAQEKAIQACKEGISAFELDRVARGYIEECGYGEQFGHGLGHGLGLDIHEAPVIGKKESLKKVPLKEGMVITIEPGVYLPGIGGVRIEDAVIVRKDGIENLTNRKKEILTIEIK